MKKFVGALSLLVVVVFLSACTPTAPNPVGGTPGRVSNEHVVADSFVPPKDQTLTHLVPFTWTHPTDYQRDVRRSEKASQLAVKSLKSLCPDHAPGFGHFAPDFRAEWGRRGKAEPIPGKMLQHTWLPDQETLEVTQFQTRWLVEKSRFVQRSHCKFKIWDFRLSTDGRAAWAKVRFGLNGLGKDGEGLSLRGEIHAVFSDLDMKLRGIRLRSGTTVSREKVAFIDVAANIGLRVHRSAAATQVIRAQVDSGLIETTGGIGVIDWNGDGFDDLFAWDARRTLQVFVNDGRGGYDTIMNPIPPEAVGLFNLYVDLDGNGQNEFVSSQIRGCQDGVAWFGLFERADGDRLVFIGRRLSFKTKCDGYRRVRYQHIAVHDVYADGDLDLFFSGFEGTDSGRKKGNSFQAANGTPNRLFINQGGHRYVEVAGKQGIAGQDFTYLAKFIDIDGDHDRDLITINDYGVNRAYTNNGRGRFSEVNVPGLTDNGQSMGLSMADLDDDEELEIYVSNMYSYAGNRIVPLVKESFAPETYRALFNLTQGNTLYNQVGKTFHDSADKLGIKNAGWAWGQAVMDLENDGDWDVYVANGNATHSDARAPDY
jgi:hypothetical protein